MTEAPGIGFQEQLGRRAEERPSKAGLQAIAKAKHVCEADCRHDWL
jgi:hypothetical protein